MIDAASETQSHESFQCANCGAPRMEYDPASGMLKCPQCGTTRPIETKAAPVVEHDLTTALTDTEKARGYGREVKTVECQSCGAVTQYDPNVTSVTCPFCGSTQVLEQQPDPNLIRPESLVPFKIDPDSARQSYKKWLGRGYFRPRDLVRRAGAERMQGVYLPFWTFDAHAESSWSAESGDYYYETETYYVNENGKQVKHTRQVQKVRWYRTSGHHSGDYDDILVKGSESLDPGILSRVSNYDTKRLVPYLPDYLSGWAAESYRIPLADAWKNGQEVLCGREISACNSEVPGDTHRNLSVSTSLSNTTFKHVLLPLWLATYRYNQKLYHFMVNGQTGQVGGQAPVDWLKVALVAVAVLIVLAILLYLSGGDNSGGLLPVFQHLIASLPVEHLSRLLPIAFHV